MVILLSPAKTLDFETPSQTTVCTQPEFLSLTKSLITGLSKLDAEEVGKLMNISPKLADLNRERFLNWNLKHDQANAKQAILAFKGDVYEGLRAWEFSKSDFTYAQKHLRVLSGLYGILKPLDLIQPYRLEMGTKLTVNGSKNLYDFWADSITKELIDELEKDSIILNLASNEYFNAINKKIIDYNIISPVFKDFKNGKLKVISFYAKKARGLMVRYLVDNNITKYEEILSFNSAGYTFSEEHTENANSPVFVR